MTGRNLLKRDCGLFTACVCSCEELASLRAMADDADTLKTLKAELSAAKEALDAKLAEERAAREASDAFNRSS